jgi:hypothetical protein
MSPTHSSNIGLRDSVNFCKADCGHFSSNNHGVGAELTPYLAREPIRSMGSSLHWAVWGLLFIRGGKGEYFCGSYWLLTSGR